MIHAVTVALLAGGAAAQRPIGPPPKPVPPGPRPGPEPHPLVDCDFYLQQLCPIGTTTSAHDTCLSCAATFDFILKKTNCTDESINNFCTTGRDCEDLMTTVGCHVGDTTSCLNCAMEHYTEIFQHHDCTWELMTVFCEQKPTNPQTCDGTLDKKCSDTKEQGQWCEGCVAGNVEELTYAGCDYETVYEYCYGGQINFGCEDVIVQYCGDLFQQGDQCFKCLSGAQDDLRRADCSNEMMQEFCSPQHPPEPPLPDGCQSMMMEYCPLSDKSDPDSCINCMREHYRELIGMGQCEKSYMIEYCDRFPPVPPPVGAEFSAKLFLDRQKLQRAFNFLKKYGQTVGDEFFGHPKSKRT